MQIGANKEDAKSMTEEGITGALIRDLKGNTRTVCFVAGSGEHQIDDSDRDGSSQLQRPAGLRTTIRPRPSTSAEGGSARRLHGHWWSPARRTIISSRKSMRIKKYVEDGGRALFMLDPPLKMGTSTIADNDALTSLLQKLGRDAGEGPDSRSEPDRPVAGVGPQVALVRQLRLAAHCRASMKGTATGFPLSRSLDIKNGDKTTVEKLFDSSDTSLATSNLSSPAVDPNDPKNKKGPLTIWRLPATTTPASRIRKDALSWSASSSWVANCFISFNGNSDLALNAVNWLSSDEDLISIRPKEQEDRRITMTRAQVNWCGSGSQFVLPLMVIAGGISVWWKRR